MTIIGWRHGANSIAAINAIKKHTGKSLIESKRLIDAALEGKAVTLPDDFVLREDLEEYKFILD
jgi:ribosomal protein L7/L12